MTILFCILIFVVIFLCFQNGNDTLKNNTPSLAISLGIFFTFTGIAWSLSRIEPGASSEEAFTFLLLGLKSAFWTSVVGLFISIICKMILASKTEAFDPHVEINKQTSAIVTAINSTSQNSAKLLSQNLAAEFKEASGHFQSEMNCTMDAFNKRIAQLIEHSTVVCDKTTQTLTQSIEMINAISDKSRDQLDRVNKFESTLLKKVNELSTFVGETIEKSNTQLLELNKTNDTTLVNIQKQNQLFDNQLASINTHYQDFISASKEVNVSVENVSTLISQLEKANSFMKVEFKQDLASGAADFKRHFQAMIKGFDEQHLKQLADAEALFKQLDNTVFNGMNEVVTAFSKGVVELFEVQDNGQKLVNKSSESETHKTVEEA